MGLFNKLKELFNKNIECGAETSPYIVFPFKKKKYIYIKKNIIVREGYTCVITYKGHVTDVLIPGKYKINKESVPGIFDRANIDKKNKKGRIIKKIRADLYFVNRSEFKDFYFLSDNPFVAKSSDIGRVKGCLQGTCTVSVLDAELLMQAILNKNRKPRIAQIDRLIALWVGNGVNKKIKKLKISPNQLLTNASSLEEILNSELEMAYDKLGIFVRGVKLKAVDFKKKYKKKIGEYMAKHRKLVKPNITPESTYKPYQMERPMVRASVNRENTSMSANSVNTTTMQNSQKTHEMVNFKICDRCGCKNDILNKICDNCGKNF